MKGETSPQPFVLNDASGEWKMTAARRSVAGGINIEMRISHANTKERLLVLSSDISNDTPESLSVFANQLQYSFSSYQMSNAVEKEAYEMGLFGREIQFELSNEKEAFECRLFVFPRSGRPWAVLHTRPKNSVPMLPDAFDLLRKRPQADGVETLDPYRVKSIPLTSYPISFRITRDRFTNMVSKIVVDEVPEKSETERAGVRPGDWVIRINGRDIKQIPGGVDNHTELGRIFIDRPLGETVALDLVSAASNKPYSVTLRSRGQGLSIDFGQTRVRRAAQ